MNQTTFDSRLIRLMAAILLALLLLSHPAFGDEVSWERARQVARNKIRHHVALYGDWNHVQTPAIADEYLVRSDNVPVAYNFDIQPSGHILVAMDDAFSPVLLYSTTSSFNTARLDRPNSIEGWMIPEISRQLGNIKRFRNASGIRTVSESAIAQADRISRAWQFFQDREADGQNRLLKASLTGDEITRAAILGPLLETAWGQSSPYNLFAPTDGCQGGENTVTGCVATAWAQLMRYWRWPLQGEGGFSYTWTGETTTATLAADFGATTYDWGNMPAVIDANSSTAEKEAVALLMYHAGISAEMEYGCLSSGSYAWADDVLDQYFRYKHTMAYRDRSYYAADRWFALIKTELDADPPRPILMGIIEASGAGGHEIVVDGYQSSTTNKVHINYGWEGHYDGYYDIDSTFVTDPYSWSANEQFMVIGIEPDNDPPVVTVAADQTVEEGIQVQLSGSAVDPEGAGISSYQWIQSNGPAVTLAGADSTTITFTSPQVDAQTDLVFTLRANDVNLGYGTKSCTVTVNNTDGSGDPDPEPEPEPAPQPEPEPEPDLDPTEPDTTDTDASGTDSDPLPHVTSRSSGSSGGCFLGVLSY